VRRRDSRARGSAWCWSAHRARSKRGAQSTRTRRSSRACRFPPGDDRIAAGAFDHVAIRADAYATTQAGLYEALELAALEDRAARARGALRLTWLGSLGAPAPLHVGPVGRAYPLDEPMLIGRDAGCAVVLRTGAHSDQNTVARRHARVEFEPAGVRVRDLRSTNGTWVNGSRVNDRLIAPGAELAFACTFRFRLDGAAG
jgi:hypothetical protein